METKGLFCWSNIALLEELSICFETIKSQCLNSEIFNINLDIICFKTNVYDAIYGSNPLKWNNRPFNKTILLSRYSHKGPYRRIFCALFRLQIPISSRIIRTTCDIIVEKLNVADGTVSELLSLVCLSPLEIMSQYNINLNRGNQDSAAAPPPSHLYSEIMVIPGPERGVDGKVAFPI